MDDTGPVEIWTEGGKFDPPTYTEPESRARGEQICKVPMVFFRYANGVTVKLDKGSEGGGIFIGEHGKIDLSRGRVKSNPPEIGQEITKHAGRNQNHIKNWLDCIQSGDRPVADVEIGHRSATVCHLGNIARWTGRKLRWDPVKETFPDDAAACGIWTASAASRICCRRRFEGTVENIEKISRQGAKGAKNGSPLAAWHLGVRV